MEEPYEIYNLCLLNILTCLILGHKVARQLCNLVNSAGKKAYLLSVGKPTPAKLGNFMDIQVFCFVGCLQSLVDSREFMIHKEA